MTGLKDDVGIINTPPHRTTTMTSSTTTSIRLNNEFLKPFWTTIHCWLSPIPVSVDRFDLLSDFSCLFPLRCCPNCSSELNFSLQSWQCLASSKGDSRPSEIGESRAGSAEGRSFLFNGFDLAAASGIRTRITSSKVIRLRAANNFVAIIKESRHGTSWRPAKCEEFKRTTKLIT